MQDPDKEIQCSIALTRVPRLSYAHQRMLLDAFGSATAIYENRTDIGSTLPDTSDVLCHNIAKMDEWMPRAEQEMEWANSKHIQCICLGDAAYPARLRQCVDAPTVLYYRGTADLNAIHILSIVGSRQCSEYGKDICAHFLAELAQLCPDCLVVSGLAYGIDINAHRNALQHNLPTLGVLAHGLDQIYPRHHQETAVKMLSQGGLLTEYMRGTNVDKMNFVARNRIVAGLADATIVVESASKGGSLITARLANDYHREVFAFPGRITDVSSAGCNNLIQQNKALLITSATDVMAFLQWSTDAQLKSQRQQPVQRELFLALSDEEERILQALQGVDGKAINQLSIETGLTIGVLSAKLLNLEMMGAVKLLNGGMYRLL